MTEIDTTGKIIGICMIVCVISIVAGMVIGFHIGTAHAEFYLSDYDKIDYEEIQRLTEWNKTLIKSMTYWQMSIDGMIVGRPSEGD